LYDPKRDDAYNYGGHRRFVVVWITNWKHADFVAILLYSFITGNLATLAAMTRLARFFSPFGFPIKAGCIAGVVTHIMLPSKILICSDYRMSNTHH
jgi:hypothetical protein